MPDDLVFTDREVRLADVLTSVRAKQLTVGEAAEILGRTERHIRRLLSKLVSQGLSSLVSKKRGRPSNNRMSPVIIEKAISVFRSELWDYGPSEASRILQEEYGIRISHEKLRQELIRKGLWMPNIKPNERIRLRRERSRCVGELLIVDCSTHEWLVGQVPCSLVVFIDDATSRLMHLNLMPTETASAYLAAAKRYIEQYGRPVTVYGDGHPALFRTARCPHTGTIIYTSALAQALERLNVRCSRSLSPQARGRVERAHRTLQGHLPQFLRRLGAVTLESANEALEIFRERHNLRFAIEPGSEEDAHRPLYGCHNLELIFSEIEMRRVSKSLTLSVGGKVLSLVDNENTRKLAGKSVAVHRLPSGEFRIVSNDQVLESWVVV
jgi:hypothetical protein